GRAALRERVAVEHDPAHARRWQGDRARYRGARTNLLDRPRTPAVHNLSVIDRLYPTPAAA
ncbi:MAG TPA: IS5/IS1182 family transposase, partial [Chloroflexota bacterium]|nr:IS5/IS1182 family transposase [Chloroflexota bacterium]